MSNQQPIAWQVHVNDGTTLYFTTENEANLYARDTEEAGFRVLVSPLRKACAAEQGSPAMTSTVTTKGSRT